MVDTFAKVLTIYAWQGDRCDVFPVPNITYYFPHKKPRERFEKSLPKQANRGKNYMSGYRSCHCSSRLVWQPGKALGINVIGSVKTNPSDNNIYGAGLPSAAIIFTY